MSEIYLLVEETETGSYADGSTHCILSAHTTEAALDAARDAWRASHYGASGQLHPFKASDRDACWCVCGAGVSGDTVTLD